MRSVFVLAVALAAPAFADGTNTLTTAEQAAGWKLPTVRHVTWKAPDGTEVGGVLELPPDRKEGEKLPLVVAIHGGPTTSTKLELSFDPHNGRLYFAAKGYAVLLPNYRGSTGYGDKFLTQLIGRENDIEVRDILAGVQSLSEQGVADPERVALAYTEDSEWRNRSEFFSGREAIKAFLRRKWAKELDYRLRKELWAFHGNRIAVRFEYEWHDDSGQWYRSYGNENWEFAESGLMQKRFASINDLPIAERERRLR